MPIVDLFSAREAEAQGTSDVWIYDRVPNILYVQVSNIVDLALGTTEDYHRGNARSLYRHIQKNIAHEHGIDWLGNGRALAHVQVHNCLRTCTNTRLWLDVVEFCFRLIEEFCGPLNRHDRQLRDITIPAAVAVEELNERFRRAGFGYRYEAGKIIRIDTEFSAPGGHSPCPRATERSSVRRSQRGVPGCARSPEGGGAQGLRRQCIESA